MPNYRKKPVTIEARQFDGTNAAEIAAWCGGKAESATCHGDGPPYLVVIDTLEGRMVAGRDDYVIRGVKGEFYPCREDIFAATYEPADTVPARHETPDVTELRDQIAGTIHRRICEHSREDCIENLGKCERATDSAMPLISTALDEGHAMARLLADALKDAIRTLRELAEKAAGEPIPFGDFDLYAEVVDGALDVAAERDALAAAVERVRALHHEGAPFVRPGGQDRRCSCGGRWPCPTIRALDESEANK